MDEPEQTGRADRGDTLDRIEALITELVRTAPRLDPVVVAELVERLRSVGPLHAQPLARAIAAVVALVAEGRIDPGIALPPLAMACATLADGARGAFTGPANAAIDRSPSIESAKSPRPGNFWRGGARC